MKRSIVHKIVSVVTLVLFTISGQAQQDDRTYINPVSPTSSTIIDAYKSVKLSSVTILKPVSGVNIQVKIVQKPNQLYLDKDGDGFGILSTFYHATTHAAFKSSEVVGDCDDNNADIHPNTQWGLNPNGDGVTIQGNIVTSCQSPGANYIIVNGQEAKFNWTHSAAYDNYGKPIASSRTYFDDLGKANLSLSKDYTLNKIWATETAYDDFGRESKTSFPAFSPYSNFKKFGLVSVAPSIVENFVWSEALGHGFVENIPNPQYYQTFDNHAKYYSIANTEEPYQAIAEQPYTQINYDALNPGNVINVVGGNTIGGEWKTGYSFTAPAAQEMYYAFGYDYFYDNRDADQLLAPNLIKEFELNNGNNYMVQILDSESDELIAYEDITFKPIFNIRSGKFHEKGDILLLGYPGLGSKLIVRIIAYVGGNENSYMWQYCYPQVFNSYKDANNHLNLYFFKDELIRRTQDSNNVILSLKSHKQISIDPMGVETVSFTDSDGKALAVARSGGTTQYPVTSLIGEQGYVDIHIPVGCSGATFLGEASFYKVYNLKTGVILTEADKTNLQPGVYRVESTDNLGLFPYTYIDKTTGAIAPVSPSARGVSYNVNYYDYSLNVYNKTGQLIKTVQPNGYEANTVIKAQPAHMAPNATAFITTYKYNTLGQLIETTSPDEGTAKFAYRPDGQIRFSQNSLQVPNSKISYTEYDTYGRPIESGIIAQNNAWSWYVDLAKANGDLPDMPKSEQTFTIYDYNGNASGNVPILPSLLLDTMLDALSLNYSQKNLSGNVACSWNSNSVTWYSYDIYGRLEWMIQSFSGLGLKTIDYEYDGNGNVKKVIYQKNNASEMFVHKYTYDLVGKLLKAETSTNNTAFALQAEYKYYQDGKLKRVQLANGLQGTDYVYTLGGMLKSINHPSLLAANDPGKDNNDVFGITLDYYSGDYTRTGTNITTSANVPGKNQDYYDGNIKATRWANRQLDVPTPGAPANTQAYLYKYNQNKWLNAATYATINPTTQDITAIGGNSEQSISYDKNGNIKALVRTAPDGYPDDLFTYNYGNGNNQLSNLTDGTGSPNPIDIEGSNDYTYDAIGRLTQNVKENLFYTYNTQGLVTEVKKGTNSIVKFYYNERGHRTKKESYSPSTGALTNTEWSVLDASGNLMSTYAKPTATNVLAQGELPVYGASRLGVFYKDATNTNYQYQITDHLGNVRAVIKNTSGAPTLQSYADYYPFGEKLFSRNSSSNYRYAFQGQQLDGETGMEAFELRLWDGRIGRWLSPDPYGEFHSPYLGMGNNPVSLIDPDGGCIECPRDAKIGTNFKDSYGDVYTMTKNGWGTNGGYAGSLNEVVLTAEMKPVTMAEGVNMAGAALSVGISALEERMLDVADNFKSLYGNVAESATEVTEKVKISAGNIARNAKIGGATLGFISSGYNFYKVTTDIKNTGKYDKWDVIDGTVGFVGAVATTMTLSATAPVWVPVIAGTATAIGIARLTYQVYDVIEHRK